MTKRICSIEGCGNPHQAKGYCKTHYMRQWHRGDASYVPPTLADRLWKRVDKSGECWTWTGNHTRGYGIIRDRDRSRLVHRLSYELLVGPVPEGLQLDHLCRTRLCVNPAHLEPVTAYENARRRDEALGIGRASSTCARGHEWSPENTGYKRTGTRECLTCHKDAARRRKAAKRAE